MSDSQPLVIPYRFGTWYYEGIDNFAFLAPYLPVEAVGTIEAIDLTFTQAEPVQCFGGFYDAFGSCFYWDSQSTGEGLGVTMSWRGLQVFHADGPERPCSVVGNSSATLYVGCTISGHLWLVPSYPMAAHNT